MSHPGSQGCDIDLSSANVLEILLAYRAFRQTLNASYSNENIVRKVERRPQYRKTLEKVRDTFVLLCNLGQRYSDIVRISPENFERNMFRIIQKKTGNKAIVDIDKYAIIPRLTYKLLKKYNYCSPYTSTVSNYNRYLHTLLQLIGEEFNDTIITEVRTGGIICRNERRKWELCTNHTGRRTFISYNVMRCQTEAEVRKCS